MGAHAAFFGADSAQHPGFSETLGYVFATLDRPDAFAGGRKNARRQIRRQDLDGPSVAVRKVRAEDHGQSVRLFAAGAGRAPDADPLRDRAGVAEGAPMRQHRRFEKVELLWLAKEA